MNVSTRNRLLTGWVAAGLVFVVWNVVSYQAHNLEEDTFTTTNAIEVSQTDDLIAFKAKALRRYFSTLLSEACFVYVWASSGSSKRRSTSA